MSVRLLFAALGTVALLSTGIAQGAPASQKPRSAKSIECSKQADAKGLHGKERRKFRRACIKQTGPTT
jgi:psiF repeat